MTSLTQCVAPSNGVSATNLVVTLTTNVAAGEDLFVFTIMDGIGSGYTMSDSKGNLWNVDNQSSTTTTGMRAHLWRCHVLTPLVGGTDTVTFFTTVACLKALSAFKVSGNPILVSSPDKTATSTNQSTATPVTASSGALSQFDELAIACYGWVSTTTFGEPAGFTNVHGAGVKLATQTTVREGAVTYQETAVKTALNPSATLGVSLNSLGFITTYRVVNNKVLRSLRPHAFSPGIAR